MSLLITLLIWCLILGVIYWAITIIPLPPPFKTIALVIFALFVILILLDFLTGSIGLPRLR